MDEPVPWQERPEERPVTPVEVWERLDQTTRDRVIELFAHLALRLAAALHEKTTKEGEGVSPRSEKQDRPGAH